MSDISAPLHAPVAQAVLVEAAGVRDCLALMKPRVMSLVVFTAFVGLMLAPGALHPVLALTAILCIAVGAGAAGARLDAARLSCSDKCNGKPRTSLCGRNAPLRQDPWSHTIGCNGLGSNFSR